MFIRLLAALVLLAGASAAQAEWREASSRNFVVYSEGSEQDLRDFTEKLERFDFVLRRIHNVEGPPSPYRLRVFLFLNTNAVGRMAGSSGVAGYYVSDARGQMMVGTRNSRNQRIEAEAILLHEYTHHFMYRYFPATYPTWYSEGFAEFWGVTKFMPNNVVEVGHPVEHRLGAFRPDLGFTNMSRWLHVRDLLTAQSYRDVAEVDLLYALGWLLVRYTWDNPERRRQLQQYLALINGGTSYADAANQSFGDLNRLNRELFEYSGNRRFNVVQLPLREFDIGQITIRTVSPAEQALMEYEIRLSQGVANTEFAAFAAEVRTVAGRFPNDPFAQRLLTEVERTGNNREAALAAVERLLAAAPNDARGLMHKGMLQIDALRAANSTDRDAWNASRQLIARAAQADQNDPIIFEAFYDAHAAEGTMPPEAAQAALYRAHELAPSDDRLTYKLASDFEQRGMIPEAIAIIRPDAYRVPPRTDESDRERQRRQRLEDRYRRAGTSRTESPRDMLNRLTAKLQQERQGGQPAPATPPRPAGN